MDWIGLRFVDSTYIGAISETPVTVRTTHLSRAGQGSTDPGSPHPTPHLFSMCRICIRVLQLKLVNHDDDRRAVSSAPQSAEPRSSYSSSTQPMDSTAVPGKSVLHQRRGDDEARDEAEPSEEQGESSWGKGPAAAGTLGVSATTDAATDLDESNEHGGNVGGANGEYGEAMIDEQEYAEDHHEEQKLFESMQELLMVMFCTTSSVVSEYFRWLTVSIHEGGSGGGQGGMLFDDRGREDTNLLSDVPEKMESQPCVP